MLETIYLFALCLVGIIIVAGALEGFLLGVGRIQLGARVPLFAAGFLIAVPTWQAKVVGVVLATIVIPLVLLGRRQQRLAAIRDGDG